MTALISQPSHLQQQSKPSRSRASTRSKMPMVGQTYDISRTPAPGRSTTVCPRTWWSGEQQAELGTIKAEEKPSYEKLIDLSVVQAALTKAGGRLKGDKRWD
jgi:hypothetical protein